MLPALLFVWSLTVNPQVQPQVPPQLRGWDLVLGAIAVGSIWWSRRYPLAVGIGMIPIGAFSTSAMIAVIVPILWQYVGYHMLLMYTAIKTIPHDIYEAALIDGANRVQTAFRITIPLIKPILKVCATFAIVGALKSFDLIFAMTQGGPMGKTDVPSTLMVETVFRSNQFGYGSSMAIIIIAMCFASSLLIKKFFRVDE